MTAIKDPFPQRCKSDGVSDLDRLTRLYANAISRAEQAEERLRRIETAIDGGRFEEWTLSEIIGQCRMQSRNNLDPEFSQFMAEVANRLSKKDPVVLESSQ